VARQAVPLGTELADRVVALVQVARLLPSDDVGTIRGSCDESSADIDGPRLTRIKGIACP
jgi:hypothetical protein